MKLRSVQYLRAIAATMVVFCHASTSLVHRGVAPLLDLTAGAYGVDIFFVVSGFIMVLSTAGRAVGPGEFLVRRLIRIFPLYFLLTTLLWAVALWILPDAETISPSTSAYVQSVLFIPHWNPTLHSLQPLIAQGWTLNYEMFFYLVFAIGLVGSPNVRVPAVISALCLLCLAGTRYSGLNPFVLTYTNPLLMEFAFGILLGHALILPASPQSVASRPILMVSAALIASSAVACGILAPRPGEFADYFRRLVLAGVPSAFLLAALVRTERAGRLPVWPPLVLLGDASYSLYLTHSFVMAIARRLWQRAFDVTTLGSNAAFIMASTAASIAVALAVYLWVERPITDVLTDRWKRISTVSPSAVDLPR
jgi:exopolysaccharide production protein ExoZ